MTDAYPLRWPQARPRTQVYRRKNGHFKSDGKPISISQATDRLQGELERIGANNPVLSANLQRNLNGSPRSGQAQPADPGVALYFTLKGKAHCLPCDTFNRVEQNIAALAAHLEATRAIERYGVATVAEMFTGFVAIASGPRPWREVLAFGEGYWSESAIDTRYRLLAKDRHPDRPGGSDALMAELNVARDAALKEINGK